MKRKLSIAVVILLFLIGVAIMSYPYVASILNNVEIRNFAAKYEDEVNNLAQNDYNSIYKGAKKYNKSLTATAIITDPFDEKAYKSIGADYEITLNVDGKGLIGFVEVPKIDVMLPIYHGTDKDILKKGGGHLMNTSMPIGGKNTHAVISAHSGYPDQTFFDYLTDLVIGDKFYIKILNEKLEYEVDQIKVVKPENTKDMRIIPGEDHVTLLTCTPYGINTHRLLVRGKRVTYVEPKVEQTGSSEEHEAVRGYYFVSGLKIPYWGAVAAVLLFAVTVAVVVLVIVRKNNKKQRLAHAKTGDEPSLEEAKNGE